MTGRARLALVALATALAGCQEGEIRLSSGADLDATSPAIDGAPGTDAGDASLGPAPDGGAPSDAAHGCATDKDCPLATLHCDVTSGVCVPCVRDDQCTKPGLPRCDLASHHCVACGVNADCADGGVCDPATRRCAIPCGDGGCPEEQTCNAHGYCSSCTLDGGGCGAGSVCDDDHGSCGECAGDSDCPPAAPRCNRESDRCVQCLTSSDCPSATPVCDPSTWTCVP